MEIFEVVLTVHQEFQNWAFPVNGVARNQRQFANTKSRNISHTQSTCMWPQMNRRFSINLIVDYNSNKCECSVAQSCPILCDPMDCSLPGSSVHGVFQARILEWVSISSSRGSSPPRDWIWSPTLQVDSLPSEPPGKTSCPKDGSYFTFN